MEAASISGSTSFNLWTRNREGEVRSQQPGVRSQKPEVRNQNLVHWKNEPVFEAWVLFFF